MRGGGLAITHGGTSFRLHRLESLHDLGFLERKGNVVFPGRPFGVGETHEEMHLAIRLAVTASRGPRTTFDDCALALAYSGRGVGPDRRSSGPSRRGIGP